MATTFNLSIGDVASLAVGGTVTIQGPAATPAPPPPPPVTTPAPGPLAGPGVIYANGKLLWPGDWDGSSLKANYSDTTKIPGLTVASMTSITQWAYWLPFVLHLATSQFKDLVLQLKPAVAKQVFSVGGFTSVLNPDGTWKTDVLTGSVSNITQYGGVPDANGVITYTIPVAAFGAASIDLYKIIVQDQSGLIGDVWDVVYAAFV